MRRPLSRVACLLAAVAVLAAGCEQPLADDDSAATPGQPAAEGSGPEPPAPKSGTKPAIEVPDLPIGQAYNDGTAMRRCLTVAWLPPPDIPDGVTIEVTDVWFEPRNIFTEKAFDGCRNRLCEKKFVFRADLYETKAGQCFVPAIARRQAWSAELKMSGKIRCPAGESRLCTRFAAAVKQEVTDEDRNRFTVDTPDDFPPSDPPATGEFTGPPPGGGG